MQLKHLRGMECGSMTSPSSPSRGSDCGLLSKGGDRSLQGRGSPMVPPLECLCPADDAVVDSPAAAPLRRPPQPSRAVRHGFCLPFAKAAVVALLRRCHGCVRGAAGASVRLVGDVKATHVAPAWLVAQDEMSRSWPIQHDGGGTSLHVAMSVGDKEVVGGVNRKADIVFDRPGRTRR